MGDHMPVHLGAMPLSVEHALAAFRLQPGDVVIVNDPFRGGTHLPDITAVSGVFRGKKQNAGFLRGQPRPPCGRGRDEPRFHAAGPGDLSGRPAAPAGAAHEGGQVQRDVMQIILANVRTPEEREGDLLAQVMSNRRGEDRLRKLSRVMVWPRVRRSAPIFSITASA